MKVETGALGGAVGLEGEQAAPRSAFGRVVARPARAWALLALLLPMAVWGSKLPPFELLRFALGICGFFLLPGRALTRALRLRCSGEELLATSLALGLCLSNVAFAFASALHFAGLYLLCPLVAAVYLATIGERPARGLLTKPVMAMRLPILLLAIFAARMFLNMPVHAVDFTSTADGGALLAVPADGTLHIAITNELTRAFPPKNPFASDHLLLYHYAMDLSSAVFCKYLALPAASVCLRLMPVFFLGLAALGVFAFMKRLTGCVPAALATPLLVLLGEDFSYLPGIWQGNTNLWAADYFGSPSVFGLFFVNPNLPALAAFFCALIGWHHAFKQGRDRIPWLVVTAILLALAGAYKIFFGIQAVVALCLCALFGGEERRRFTLKLLAATCLVLGVLLSPALWAHSEQKVIELVPSLYTGYVPTALSKLELTESRWFGAVAPMFARRHASWVGVAQLVLLALPLFAVGTLGVRLLGIPRLIRTLRHPANAAPALVFLGHFVVSGYVLGLGLRVTPIDYPDAYNNSVWFVVASKLTSWVFVGVVLGQLFKLWSPRQAPWLATLQVLLLAAPATVNTFTAGAKNGEPTLASRTEVELAGWFRRDVAPGTVVLCESPNLRRLLLGLASAHVPYAPEFYVTSFLRRAEVDARARDLELFWRDWAAGTFRADLAARYGVQYVVSAHALPGKHAEFTNAAGFAYPLSALR